MGRGRPPNGAEWLTDRLCVAHAANQLQEPAQQLSSTTPPPVAFKNLSDMYEHSRSMALAEAMAIVREGLRQRDSGLEAVRLP